MPGSTPARTYLDAATAMPLHPVAQQALLAALDDGWADPSRLYAEAARARRLSDAARQALADVIGCHADEIIATSSGTQAAHLAVAGAVKAAHEHDKAYNAVVHSTVEHSAVLRAVDEHCAHGGRRVAVPVDRTGVVDLDAWRQTVHGSGIALAALMHANHEVGTVQPVSAAGQACAVAHVPFYVDVSAALGWRDSPDAWSLLSASARKWGGPAGVGILAVRRTARWSNPLPHAPEEHHVVPGGASLPNVVAAAASLRAFVAERTQAETRLRALIDRIRTEVASRVADVEVVGDPLDRLPHIVTFSCLYVDGEALVHALNAQGFSVSSGSACTSETGQPSHVLTAMGVLSHGNVRVSLHPGITAAEVDRFLDVLPETVRRLRATSGVADI